MKRIGYSLVIIIVLLSCQVTRNKKSHLYYSINLGQTLSIEDTVLIPGSINLPMRELLMKEDFSQFKSAIDIGTGSGILSYILAKKGLESIISTDINPKAILTVKKNSELLGYDKVISPVLVKKSDSPFKVLTQKVDLIISNPPWFDSKPLDLKYAAFYDEKLSLLVNIIKGLKKNLNKNGMAILELGGKDALKICERELRRSELKYKIKVDSIYGKLNRPYRIYQIKL